MATSTRKRKNLCREQYFNVREQINSEVDEVIDGNKQVKGQATKGAW